MKSSNLSCECPGIDVGLLWTVALHRFRKPAVLVWIVLFASPVASLADDSSVAIDVPHKRGWVGERIPILVELRTRGSFSGAASFDLPEVPGALLIKIGNPVIDSREIDGERYFVQTHEFALFSQRVGPVAIPEFPVRFAAREGFTGPVKDIQLQTPAVAIELRRPPGTEGLEFVVSTQELMITEEWSIQPDLVKVGDVIRRTVSQRAQSIPGMALAPLPSKAPDGIRVYPETPEISDRTERGAFVGQRTDVLNYLIQKPGQHILPALVYNCWDPVANRLESKTLPAMTINVPMPALEESDETELSANRRWIFAATVLIALFPLLVWQRKRFRHWHQHVWSMIHSPERVGYRKLLRACRQNDAPAAYRAWFELKRCERYHEVGSQEIATQIVQLEQQLYGKPGAAWKGLGLATAVREYQRLDKKWPTRPMQSKSVSSRLPPLNPKVSLTDDTVETLCSMDVLVPGSQHQSHNT